MFYVVSFVIVINGVIFTSKRRVPAFMILLLVAAILPWIAVRHLPLFVIAAVVFAGEHIMSAWIQLSRPKPKVRVLPLSLASLPLLLSIAGLVWIATRDVHKIVVDKSAHAINGVEILARSGVTGNLVTEFNWGEYIIWHLGPKIKVSMDGRRETVYPPDYYQDYLNLRYGVRTWDKVLIDYPTDMMLLSKDEPTQNLVRLKPEWRAIYEDETSVLFVRKDSPLLEPLQKAAADFVPTQETHYFP